MFKTCINKALQVTVMIVLTCGAALAQGSDAPVDFTADTLTHDDATQIVTATGNVELIQEEQILNADQVTYDLTQDLVVATGNVSLLDSEGQVHFADRVELSNQMKDGFVTALVSYLGDGSRFRADEGERINQNKHVMRNASFTPCKTCLEDLDKDPTWQIKADEVIYDEVEGSVKYDNARLELMGVPIAYTPYFSHPDPQIEQKSGFLRPDAGWDSNLGFYGSGTYYWGLDMTKDVALMVQPTSRQGVLLQPEYRQRFENGYINLDPSIAFFSDRTEVDGRVERNLTRGHLEGRGRFDLTDTWRSGFDVMKTTDDEYLRLYDISNENVLQNTIYAERLSGRNYTNINAQHYQDVRINFAADQPDVLPSMTHYMVGAPESFLGGRFDGEFGVLGLKRGDEGQDVYRASAEGGWRFDHITDFGLSLNNRLSSRVDYYYVQDFAGAPRGVSADDTVSEARFFPQLHTEATYPLVKTGAENQYVIEPKLAFTAGSQSNETDIPNEDSQDIQLDALNLFASNRFPGEDLQDSGTRVTYGLGAGLYEDDGSQARVFFGQSYRFDDDNNYPDGSGLEDNYSDYVGSFQMNFNDPNIFVDYRFQLDNDNLSPQRHELQASGNLSAFTFGARYTYAAGIPGTLYPDSREQMYVSGNYRFNPNWNFESNVLYDLGEEPGLRKARAGFGYTDDCFNFGLYGGRSVTDRTTGESEVTLLARIGFKYLGQFTSPQILLAAEGDTE